MAYRIGVDFDNTLVTYDEILRDEAFHRGWLTSATISGKQAIRDAIRQRPQGEEEWQHLQAVAYSRRISDARLMAGVEQFFAQCRQQRSHVFIISHKTEAAAADPSARLRASALSWMEVHGFFNPEGFGLLRDQVYFESTRREKLQRIASLHCTHFIDDLEETFLDAAFPAQVARILYAPGGSAVPLQNIRIARTWQEITTELFPHVAR